MEKKAPSATASVAAAETTGKHVGGVNDQLGGVDPDVDANLMRLSGGP